MHGIKNERKRTYSASIQSYTLATYEIHGTRDEFARLYATLSSLLNNDPFKISEDAFDDLWDLNHIIKGMLD